MLTTVCVQAMGELIGGPTDVHLCAVFTVLVHADKHDFASNRHRGLGGGVGGVGGSTEEHFTQLAA